jgi:hypothetical protein
MSRIPDESLCVGEESDATILYNFFVFLIKKSPDLVFNVPRGKIDIIEKYKLKYFLYMNGQNKEIVEKPLRLRGWKALPFFVIDPYDRSSFSSIETGLTEGSAVYETFVNKIKESIKLIEQEKSPLV